MVKKPDLDPVRQEISELSRKFREADARCDDLTRQAEQARAKLSKLELAAEGAFREMLGTLKALVARSPKTAAAIKAAFAD